MAKTQCRCLQSFTKTFWLTSTLDFYFFICQVIIQLLKNVRPKAIHIKAPTLFIGWCLFILCGCKDPAIEDSRLLTGDDNLNLMRDTLQVTVANFFETGIVSGNISTGFLGNITDPAFGKTLAGIYAQCRINSNNLSFGENPQLDSVVLSLRYSGLYGKFNIPVNVNVYELSQSIIDSGAYTLGDAFQVFSPPIGTLSQFTPKITDSVPTINGNLAPHLRVKLSNSFGNKILLADTNALRDVNTFLQLFKGFYITVASNTVSNGYAYLDLRSSVSGITLYYRNNTSDSLSYSIPVTGRAVQHVDQVYTGSPVAASVSTPNTAGEPKAFLQGGSGVYSLLSIKGIDSLPANLAVNKAELILTQSAEDTAFTPPLVLNLFRTDAAKTALALDDESLAHFGGVRTTESLDGQTRLRYRFNIKKYFQYLLQGRYNNDGLLLKALSPATNSERLVISNTVGASDRILLIITYTKL